MQILVDTANPQEAKEAFKHPFVNGCTTNTREVAYNSGKDLLAYVKEMRSIVKGVLHFQVTTETAEEMIAEGRVIASLASELRVKIPVNLEGLKAIKQLSSEGIECAATACNTVGMGLLAAQMGATSVISYYGVVEDFETDGGDLLKSTRIVFDNYGCKTKIFFFARNAKEAKNGMLAGADGCLMTWSGLKSLVDDPLSTREVLFMNSEWKRLRGNETWRDVKNN